jgi:hypothetical protein
VDCRLPSTCNKCLDVDGAAGADPVDGVPGIAVPACKQKARSLHAPRGRADSTQPVSSSRMTRTPAGFSLIV